MNKVFIIGRLGKEPELKYTATGTPCCNFSVATSEKKKDSNEELTEWHSVLVWGKSGENCEKYLKKGSQVFIEGSVRTREWEKDKKKFYKTEIHASAVNFI